MATPFVGEISMFGGNFAPAGWEFCNGQLIDIFSNTALFSLLGTIYGGDGRTTFGLPDLRGRLAMHSGSGPGLTPRPLGERGGRVEETISPQQMGSHAHGARMRATTDSPDTSSPTGNVLASVPGYRADLRNFVELDLAPDALTLAPSGASPARPHTNVMPYVSVHYIIATDGIFPSRS